MNFSKISTSFNRILLVDDFEPIRKCIRAILERNLGPQAIFEASDGDEAVLLATELQPELILMDINLPMQSGISAAREIRNLAPRSHIIFLSSLMYPELVRTAFKLGARGYVLKTDIPELMTAISMVRQGERFASRSLDQVWLNEPTSD